VKRIAIVDYGMGNIGSLQNMVGRAGGEPVVVNTAEQVRAAGKLILPGVGAFDNAMEKLTRLGLADALTASVLGARVPVLCICLGAQLVMEQSEEGRLRGLGWILGGVKRFSFPPETRLRVPHMGWNEVSIVKASRLFEGMQSEPCFYFVHSYYLEPAELGDVLTTSVYGITFASALERGNIFATQFHPEKSHTYGLRLVQNFVGI
jgi:glutamine amidotransferase